MDIPTKIAVVEIAIGHVKGKIHIPNITEVIATNINIINYKNPKKIVYNHETAYILDNNNILYFSINDSKNIYSFYNYNYSVRSNILDIVQDFKYLYVRLVTDSNKSITF